MENINYDQEIEKMHEPAVVIDDGIIDCVTNMICSYCELESDAPNQEIIDRNCKCQCHINVN